MGDQAEQTSKSVVLTGYGGYDNLKIQEYSLRTVGPEDVLVSVEMCGMNFADLYTRQGLMRDRQPPFVLGIECAGTVLKKGEKVHRFKVGDRVICYQCSAGLFRASVIVPAAHCFLLPDEMTWEDAAAFAVNYLTAYFCVLDIGNLRPGQSILIHSCAGGVGWAATQLARTVQNVTIYGTCSRGKEQAAFDNGVTHAMNYDSYLEELKNTSPRGVDIIIDSLAGTNFSTSQSLLKPLGRVILIGAKSVITGNQKLGLWSMVRMWWKTKTINAFDLIMENRVVAGLHLQHLIEKEPERVKEAMDRLFILYTQGKVKPKIDSIWSMEQVVDASKVLAERKNVGKVLLKVVPSDPVNVGQETETNSKTASNTKTDSKVSKADAGTS